MYNEVNYVLKSRDYYFILWVFTGFSQMLFVDNVLKLYSGKFFLEELHD